MNVIYKYTIVFSLGLLLGLAAMYAILQRGPSKPMPTGDADVPRHEVKDTAPVKALDKKVLGQRKAISGDVVKNPDKEVLATGDVKTSDGKKTVAAVLDTKTGDTVLTENKALAEWMSRHEAGLGYGLFDGYLAQGIQYRWTFGRVSSLYGTVQAEVFEVDRSENRNPYSLMVWATWRF